MTYFKLFSVSLLIFISTSHLFSQGYDFENQIIEKSQLKVRAELKPVMSFVKIHEYGENYGEIDTVGTLTKITYFNRRGEKTYEELFDFEGHSILYSVYSYNNEGLLKTIKVVDQQNFITTFYEYHYDQYDKMIKYFYFQFAIDGEYYYDVYLLYDEKGRIIKETYTKDDHLITEQNFVYYSGNDLLRVITVNENRDTISKTLYDYNDPGNIIYEKIYDDGRNLSSVNEIIYSDFLLASLIQRDEFYNILMDYNFIYDLEGNLLNVNENNYYVSPPSERVYRFDYLRNGLLDREYFFLNGKPVYYLKYTYEFYES